MGLNIPGQNIVEMESGVRECYEPGWSGLIQSQPTLGWVWTVGFTTEINLGTNFAHIIFLVRQVYFFLFESDIPSNLIIEEVNWYNVILNSSISNR